MTVLFSTMFGILPFRIAADRAPLCLGYATTAAGHIKQCRVSRPASSHISPTPRNTRRQERSG